jgi:hypothetical protein
MEEIHLLSYENAKVAILQWSKEVSCTNHMEVLHALMKLRPLHEVPGAKMNYNSGCLFPIILRWGWEDSSS